MFHVEHSEMFYDAKIVVENAKIVVKKSLQCFTAYAILLVSKLEGVWHVVSGSGRSVLSLRFERVRNESSSFSLQ